MNCVRLHGVPRIEKSMAMTGTIGGSDSSVILYVLCSTSLPCLNITMTKDQV